MTTSTDDAMKGERVRSFFQIEARTLLDRYLVIETLLPNARTAGASHRGEEGRFIESLLRSFLNKHLPSSLRAVSGFILCPATKTGASNDTRVLNHHDRHSTQIDVIIYDFDAYPVYERFEEFCIVPPEGVVGIISVKKTLYLRDLGKELQALRQAALLCAEPGRRGPCSALFAFSADEKDHDALNRKLFSEIDEASKAGSDFDSLINEVSVLGKTCAFKFRSGDVPRGKARYVGIDCRQEAHVPLQRLLQTILSVNYDRSRGATRERPGFVSFQKDTFKKSPKLGDVGYRTLQPLSLRRD